MTVLGRSANPSTGGLETAADRLSKWNFAEAMRSNADGLANSSGWVGRCLMFNVGSNVEGVFEHELNEWKSVQPSRVLWDFYNTDPDRGFYGGGGIDDTFGFVTPAAFADRLARRLEPSWGNSWLDVSPAPWPWRPTGRRCPCSPTPSTSTRS
jgi:hypothetical protein